MSGELLLLLSGLDGIRCLGLAPPLLLISDGLDCPTAAAVTGGLPTLSVESRLISEIDISASELSDTPLSDIEHELIVCSEFERDLLLLPPL